VFGDNTATTGGLLWVDEAIHEELQSTMNTGELEAALQIEHPEIISIRYISPGAELPSKPLPNKDETTDETSISTTNSALSWVLIGVGIFLLLSVFTYAFISRRRERQEEDEREASIQVGAFPAVVSQTNVARARSSQRGSLNNAVKPFNGTPREYSYPPSSNLESNRNPSESDDSDDEGVPLHVFHDDDNSPRPIPKGISTSWRDQILRIPTDISHSLPLGSGTSISLDPNQPIVRPILDDEQVGKSLSFPSMEHQSSAEFTLYHSVNSRDQDTFASSRELQKSPPSSRLSPQDLYAYSREFDYSEDGGAKSDTASSLSSSPRHRSPNKHEFV
jgi:hypothetical protein